jgi:hypothetical protein
MNRRQLLLGAVAAAVVPPVVRPLLSETSLEAAMRELFATGTAVRQFGDGLGCVARGEWVHIPNRIFFGPSMQELVWAAQQDAANWDATYKWFEEGAPLQSLGDDWARAT